MPPAVLALALLSLAAAAEEPRGFRGALAVRGDRVVAAENPERLFTPASVTKLVIAAAALHHLGPEHRTTTELRAAGRLAEGILSGDLVLAAAGDPTWSERFFPEDPRAPLAELARQLRQRGVRRVTGDLVVDTSRFPGRPHPPSRPLVELGFGFSAPTAALAVDESTVPVEIAPGSRPGEPGRVRLVPGPLVAADELRFVNRIRTAGRDRHERGTVELLPVWGSRTVVARGEYPVSEPSYRFEITAPHPELRAAEQLAQVLAQQGIEVEGEVRISPQPVAAGEVLARFRSPPLAELLPPILSDSHNWLAEMLLQLVAAQLQGTARLADALELQESFLIEEVGLAPGSFVLDDASGLAPTNLLASEAVVHLLRWIWRQPWRDVFVAALAAPGQGTLEAWPPLPPLAAKTGTLRNTMALAGYLDPQAPEPLIFVCFLGHRPEERPVLRREIAELVRGWAAAPGGGAP